MNRDDRIPFERVLMLCAIGFLLGILFGCGSVVEPQNVACPVGLRDSVRTMPMSNGDTAVIIINGRCA